MGRRVKILIILIAAGLLFSGCDPIDLRDTIEVLTQTSEVLFVGTIGGEEDDSGNSVAVDSDGNIYLTGGYRSLVDFDPWDGRDYYSTDKGSDIFLTKLSSGGSYSWTKTFGAGTAYSAAIDSNVNIFVTRFFIDSGIDFDPGPRIDEHLSNGEWDIYILGLNPE
jgi:hypothetical protein